MTTNNTINEIIEVINGMQDEEEITETVSKYLASYLKENTGEAENIIGELAAWDGTLEHLDVRENDEEFFEVAFENKYDVARAIYFGDYDYNAEYIRLDGYGHLETLSAQEREKEIKANMGEIVEELMDDWYNIELEDDLYDLMVAYDNRIDEI